MPSIASAKPPAANGQYIAVGGPKPEGGDGQLSDSPWPDER